MTWTLRIDRPTIEARFWAKVEKVDENQCWSWKAYVDEKGYGTFHIGGHDGKMVKAHRVSYELAYGPIPAGMQIDHICHKRNCVNPNHLRLARPLENAKNRLCPSINSSGFKGVSWINRPKHWLAQIVSNGEFKFLGTFSTPEEAHQAYCNAANFLHGEFAHCGEVLKCGL